MTAEATTAAAPDPGVRTRRLLVRHGWTAGVWTLLVVLIAIEAGVAPAFGSFDVNSLVIGAVPLAFAAAAQAVVVISGGIDLSVGAVMALLNVISAKLMLDAGEPLAFGLALVVILIGIGIGALTGLVVTATRVPDIVVTLATSFVWAGVALVILPTPGGGAPDGFQQLAIGTVGSEWIPTGAVVLIVASLAIWLPLRSRRPGYAIYAVGSDRDAAYLAGVRVNPTRVLAYAVGGAFAACGGLALTATTAIGNPLGGELYTLNSVAAVVLGGVSLLGGRGGVAGPIAAAFCLQLVLTILLFLGVNPNYGQVIQGGLIVLIVMLGGLAFLRGGRR